MSFNYLKKFKKKLKPVNPTLIEIFEFINQNESSNIFKSNVLEVGLGTGNKSIKLSKLFDNYYGIEPDIELYKIFLKQCKKYNCEIKSFNINLNSFIFETELKFDLIILENVIHFLNLEEFFSNVIKILNNKKYILIKNPKAKPYGWGAKVFCADSKEFNESKWIIFRKQLKNIYSDLDKNKNLVKKISNDTSHFFLFKI